MIDLDIQEISDALHVTLGMLFILIPACRFWAHARLMGTAAGIIFGIVKEFWFDLKYEDPETSGGIKGGFIDFAGYVVGIALGNLLLL